MFNIIKNKQTFPEKKTIFKWTNYILLVQSYETNNYKLNNMVQCLNDLIH